MPETIIGGVSLYSKERGKNTDLFELALTNEGIEIRRPAEEARFLSWDRITEWEIEQRRGGVLLILRGGGSVTPLSIPRWKVDDLDLVLRDVTTQWSQAVADRAAGNAVQVQPMSEEEAALAHEFNVEPAVTWKPGPEPVVVPEPEPEWEPEPEPVRTAEPSREPPADSNLAWRSTVAPHDLEREGDMDAGITPVEGNHDLVAGKLVWPDRSNLEAVPDLAWPSDTAKEDASTGPPLPWLADTAPKPRVRVIESTPEPVPVRPAGPVHPAMPEPAMKVADPKVVIHPVEGAPDHLEPPTALASRAARRSTMQTNHQQPRRKSTARVAFTVSLLGVLAVSVALVLAQSAGAVHLSFLGFAG